MTRRVARAIAVSCITLAVVGCDDKKDTSKLAPSASALAPSDAVPKATKFAIDPKSVTTLSLEAPQEKIKAKTDAALGSLDIDLTDITRTRGEVKIDLTTLTTSTFDVASKNESQTTHARTWLEVADGEDGKLDDKLKQEHRYAVYAIRSVENPSAVDVTKIAPSKDGADEVRTVTLTTKGELLVHGHKVNRDAELEARFRYDPGAPPDKPKALIVKSTKPFRVVLAEHDVKPRDGLGKIAKGSFNLLGTKVAENADIGLELRATPLP